MPASLTPAPDHDGPIIHVRIGPDGRPSGAGTMMRIERPVADVWAVLSNVERFTGSLPMVDHARLRGDLVDVALKFRVGFFSAGFEFVARATKEELKWLELRGVSGEPRGILLRFTLTPLDGGAACLARADTEFDVQSLGWLVKYFLRHHPEIEHGIFPGVSLNLVESLRRVVTGS